MVDTERCMQSELDDTPNGNQQTNNTCLSNGSYLLRLIARNQ